MKIIQKRKDKFILKQLEKKLKRLYNLESNLFKKIITTRDRRSLIKKKTIALSILDPLISLILASSRA